jgi:hypothetical protein
LGWSAYVGFRELFHFFITPNAKDELTQKLHNTLNLQKIGSAFVVSSILLLGLFF